MLSVCHSNKYIIMSAFLMRKLAFSQLTPIFEFYRHAIITEKKSTMKTKKHGLHTYIHHPSIMPKHIIIGFTAIYTLLSQFQMGTIFYVFFIQFQTRISIQLASCYVCLKQFNVSYSTFNFPCISTLSSD